jgi:carbonic anhydrase
VVLGHARCGGVRAFADDGQEPLSPGDFIGKWMQLLAPASERAGPRGRHEAFADYTIRLELASISASLANLRTFPCVKILEDRKKLSLHGAYFDVRTGVLMLLDQLTGRFVPAAAEVPARVGMVRCV